MGELNGIPDWLFATLFVIGFFVILFAFAWRNTLRQIRKVAERRASPTREEFLVLIEPDVRPSTAVFLWENLVSCLEPRLTPHPDDVLSELPIDEEEWSMDWPRDFADREGFAERAIPDWPEAWPNTVRNYGRWLDMAQANDGIVRQ